ncbi:MAG: amino acid ABC transporter substrate-binding protein [Alphaproteobacteria bacterium]|nr:amino acid ABC transporter substrate-binding protein [Alphaproteobacteria bacterium]
MKNLLLALMLLFLAMPAWAEEAPKESTYDRVMRTGTIKCGYGSIKPWIYQDLKTGKMVGVTVEIMEEVAKQLSLKLEWPEETGWANLPTSLNTGRVDVACPTMWVDPMRGKYVAYTRPLFYSAVHMYMRQGEKRFTGKMEELNQPDIKITVQDGDVSAELAKRYFPKATLISIPQSASGSELLLNVTTGKADVTFGETVYIKDFNKNNEIQLERIPLKHPVNVYANALAVGIHETELKEMLDAAVVYLLNNGKIAEIIGKMTKEYPDAVLLPSRPYE